MRKVDAEILIDVAPAEVFNAFIDPIMLQGWWGVQKLLIDKKEGGVYALTWNNTVNGFGYVFSGVISEYSYPVRLVIDQVIYFNPQISILGPMQLYIVITANNGQVVLSVCQSGYQNGTDWDWYYDAVKIAWPIVLESLKHYLENKKPSV